MPDDAARRRVAAEQAALVAALLARDAAAAAAAPAGFDDARVKLAASTLVAKRRKGVAKAWPSLAQSLGDAFPAHFDAFAREHPPAPGDPAADGYAFARWLDAHRLLPVDAVPAVVAARLWRGGLVGVGARVAAGRLVVGVRLPLLGVRIASLPWFG